MAFGAFRSSVAASSASDWPFVGRVRELRELREQLDRAMVGQGRLVQLIGEPGIGKTRIAEVLTAEALAKGANVVWGRSWEGEGAPAFWPWAQVLRTLVGDEAGGAREPAGAAARELVQILPELAGEEAAGSAPFPVDSGEYRFRLFESVATLLAGAARRKPLVMVLDDLHWADRPSLRLLHFVARGLRGMPVLILGTYRDLEIGRQHPLIEVLGQLARESSRITLGGLNRTDVGQVLAEAAGVEPAPALVTAIHAQTEGNPFFVSEAVRLLLSRESIVVDDDCASWELAVPQGAREMIIGHLGRLSEPCQELLCTAAVIGREFDTSVLERLTSRGSDQLLDTLQQAVDANVVTSVAPGRLSFTHVLFREAIYEDLSATTRLGLHREVAKAIETAGGSDASRNLALMAHHFFEADPASAKALEYSIGAGDNANRCLAYEEAARYYDRALEILDAQGGDDRAQCELLLSLGDACSKAADGPAAKAAFKAAADAARRIHAHELFARAALGYGGRFPGMVSGVVDRVLVSLLEESLVVMDDKQPALRAMLLARLSRALFYDAPEPRRLALADEALSMARGAGDGPAEVTALNARFWALSCPEDIEARLDSATEMARLAMTLGDTEMALQGHQWRLCALAELGDMVAVDREIDEYSKLAEMLHQPLYSWFAVQFRVMRALMSGRFEDAERRAHEALAAGERIVTSAPVSELFRAQLLQLLSERGGWDEAETMLTGHGDDPSSRSFAALYRCRFGHQGPARAAVAAMMHRDFASMPRDTVWLGTVVMLAEVCAMLADRAAGARLYPLLVPYADRNVMVGGALLCRGSASHFLGLLAALDSNHEQAAVHFENALKMNSGMGAPPLVARTQYEYARLLIEQQGSPEVARGLLAEATATAVELGMRPLEQQCRALAEALSGFVADPAAASSAAGVSTDNYFKKSGEYWEVRFNGRDMRVKDTKGMQYIADLLRQPGREMHVSDLVGVGGIDFGHAGARLDGKAKSQYEARIHELRDDLAEAEARHDAGRIDVATRELDFITQELAAAYGLNRRSRRDADNSERMRKAVTNRIRSSRQRLNSLDPRLGQHLANTIKTGTFCGYFPEEPITWHV